MKKRSEFIELHLACDDSYFNLKKDGKIILNKSFVVEAAEHKINGVEVTKINVCKYGNCGYRTYHVSEKIDEVMEMLS